MCRSAAAEPDAAPAAPADPALASVGNVRLRVPEALAEERRAAIVAALEAGGIADVQVETLPFAVETSRVGYYLEADRPAAEALARLVAPLVTPGGALAGPRLRQAARRPGAGSARPLGQRLT